MHARIFPIFALLLWLASTAFADLEIKEARYGSEASSRDVRGIVTAYARSNTLSFPVNDRSMGGDPSPGQTDRLFITYKANGREFTDNVQEGAVFTFQGVPNVRPVLPPLNLPFLRPASPSTAPLLVVNRTATGAHLYCVDRFGRWVWTAEVSPGQTLTLIGLHGEEWIALDDASRIVGRARISRGDNQLWISEAGERPPARGYRGEEAWVRFENAGYRPLYLYNLDSLGRWNWMATLEPGGGYSASTSVGETWIAADTANHVVRQTTVGPGLAKVKLN